MASSRPHKKQRRYQSSIAGAGVRDDGTAAVFRTDGSTLLLFHGQHDKIVATIEVKSGAQRWCLSDLSLRLLPFQFKHDEKHLQDPFLHPPVSGPVFAHVDHNLFKIISVDKRHIAHSVHVLLPTALYSYTTDVSAAALDPSQQTAAVRMIHTPKKDYSCVIVVNITTGASMQTPETKMCVTGRFHAITQDGRHVLVTEGTSGICYRVRPDGLQLCWKVQNDRTGIQHVVPCGPSHFAMRMGSEVRVLDAESGRVTKSIDDDGRRGVRFTVSSNGAHILYEDLFTCPLLDL